MPDLEVSISHASWESLRNQGEESHELGIASLPLDVETGHGPARLALGEHGDLRVLIPIGPNSGFPAADEGRELRIDDTTLRVSGRPQRFVDIQCTDVQLEEVFSNLVSEMLERITAGETVRAAVDTSIRQFRELLMRQRSRIDVSKAVGLAGELLWLLKLVERHAGAWRTWMGPSAERHDFRNGLQAVEVKTTRKIAEKSLEIATIDQLDPPQGGTLHLLHHVLESDPTGDVNVPSLVAKVTARVDDVTGFEQQLDLLGYNPVSAEHWGEFRFSLRQSQMYRVESKFPRLSKGDFIGGAVPPGVVGISYKINLSQAAEYALEPEEVDRLSEQFGIC